MRVLCSTYKKIDLSVMKFFNCRINLLNCNIY